MRMNTDDTSTATDTNPVANDAPQRSPRRPGQSLACGWWVADPAPGAGSDPEVVFVIMPAPGLGTHPRGRVGARRRPGRRPRR
jgi:hypothetical protein